MLIFMCFYSVSTLSIHLALWLMLLELDANCEAQKWFPRFPGFPFLHVFPAENANSEGRFLVAYAREAGSMIPLFQLYLCFFE